MQKSQQNASIAIRSTPTGRPIPQVTGESQYLSDINSSIKEFSLKAPLGRTATPPWRNAAAAAGGATASDSETGNPAGISQLTREPLTNPRNSVTQIDCNLWDLEILKRNHWRAYSKISISTDGLIGVRLVHPFLARFCRESADSWIALSST